MTYMCLVLSSYSPATWLVSSSMYRSWSDASFGRSPSCLYSVSVPRTSSGGLSCWNCRVRNWHSAGLSITSRSTFVVAWSPRIACICCSILSYAAAFGSSGACGAALADAEPPHAKPAADPDGPGDADSVATGLVPALAAGDEVELSPGAALEVPPGTAVAGGFVGLAEPQDATTRVATRAASVPERRAMAVMARDCAMTSGPNRPATGRAG